MNFWPSRDFLDCLGLTLLHFLWQGLLIAALLAIALRLLRRSSANTRYLISCLALFLMALAPIATFYSLATPNNIHKLKFTVEEIPATDDAIEIPASSRPSQSIPLVSLKPTAHETDYSAWFESALPWLVGAWSLGVFALSCRLFAGWLVLRRLRRTASAALLDPWHAKLKQLAARIGVSRPIRLLQSVCVEVPTVIGWLRPVILLPASCLTGLTPAQLESILAHELAHIRRHDYLVNLLQSLVETLLFYHPAVWWTSRRIRSEREHCCDDLAVKICGDALAYARALATLEEMRPTPAQLALAAGGAPLLERIRRLAGQQERSPVRPAWPVAGIVTILLLAIIAASFRNSPASAQTAAALPPAIQPQNSVPATIIPVEKKEFGQVREREGKKFEGTAYSQGGPANQNSTQPSNNSPPPIINIKTKWIEVNMSQIGTTNLSSWLRDMNEFQTSTNVSASFEFSDFVTIKPTDSTGSNQLFHYFHHDTNDTPLVILPPPQTSALLKKLESQDGVDILTAPEITTESGRQAQIQAVDLQTILTGPPSTNNQQLMPFGPILDVIPFASADGHSVKMTTVASITEFLGYEDPATVTNAEARHLPKNSAIPHFRMRQFTSSFTVESGQTVLLGSAARPVSTKQQIKQKVPILGDIPLLGPLFRSTKSNTSQVALMLLVTPTLLNPDGTLYHPTEQPHHEKSAGQPNPSGRTNLVFTSEGRQKILSKLDSIRVASIAYDHLPLSEVIRNLSVIAKARDPERTGINFFISHQVINTNGSAPGAINPVTGLPIAPLPTDAGSVSITIKPELNDVRLSDLLDAIAKTADTPIKYSILDYAVVFSLRNPNESPPLEIRSFHVNQDSFFQKLGIDLTNDARTGLRFPPPNEADRFHMAVCQLFASAGAEFDTNIPPKDGKVFTYISRHSVLTVRATAQDLEKIVSVIDLAGPIETPSHSAVAAPPDEPRTDILHASKGKQAIMAKLKDIVVPEVEYNNLPLEEVINHLSRTAESLDPKKTGINFFLSHETAPGTIDPATGLPAHTPNVDIKNVSVTINPALKAVHLSDLLDAITRTADQPIKYSVLDYAIVFSLRGPDTVPLEIRTYHIDPRKFSQMLEDTFESEKPADNKTNVQPPVTRLAQGLGLGDTGREERAQHLASIQAPVRRFFAAAGIDFNTNNPANINKAFAWNDRKGVLTIRATKQDLDLLGSVIETLDMDPPMINLDVKIAIIDADNQPALGFTWTHKDGSPILPATNSAPTPSAASSSNPSGIFSSLASGTNAPQAPFVSDLTGILTEAQYQIALTTLKNNTNVQFLNARGGVTITGRRAQIQAEAAGGTNATGFVGAPNGVNSPIINQPGSVKLDAHVIPVAPSVDIVPYVSAEGFSVDLNVVANLPEFIGYDSPGELVTDMEGKPMKNLALPHFRLRQKTTAATICDGQTLVLASTLVGASELTTNSPAKKTAASPSKLRNVMIFITPTIINSDGTHFHSEAQKEAFLQSKLPVPAVSPAQPPK